MGKYKNIKKVGLAIICFEGTEHLYNIISTLRQSVDYVSLGLQRLSYHGDKISEIDLQEIFRLRDEDKILDSIVEIELDTTKPARVQETDKRNILIQDAEDNGCSHVIVIDSDEYYTRKSFESALQKIDENDYEMTYCQYVNYYHDYEHYLKYPFPDGMYVPFVSKTKYRHSFECSDFFLPSDPTRRYVRPYDRIEKKKNQKGEEVDVKHYTVDYHVFEWNEVKMHHLSWLRADIRKKLNSWSSKKLFENYDDLIDRAVDSFNSFDENDDKAQALMLFNTPDNKVDVTRFPRQFIHPPVDYHTRLRPVKEKKKLLFLSMSADFPIFNELDDACNETWRNYDRVKYPGIDAEFWTYTDAKPGEQTWIDKDKHIIYVERDYTNLQPVTMTYSKTLIAINEIHKMNIEYDYIIRTNTSTWINVPLINEFLSYQSDNTLLYGAKLYAAFWSAFNIYCGGQLMVWSKRNVDIILNLSGSIEQAKKDESNYLSADDNMIYSRLNSRMNRLGVLVSDYYHSLGGTDLIDVEIDKSNIDFACVEFQVKTWKGERSVNDVRKMKEIDELWRQNIESIETLYQRMMEKWYDKVIVIINKSKGEYFDSPEKDREFFRLDENNHVPRNEAFKLITNRQKELGYAPGRFLK